MALAMPQAAQAAVTANFDPGTGVLTVVGDTADDSLTVARNGDNITLTANGQSVPIIGGTPTVSNTETIAIDVGAGVDTVTIDVSNGPLAPGKTTEMVGAPEIEVDVVLGAGNDTLVFNATSVTDLIGLGQLGSARDGLSVNLDADLDDVSTTGNETVRVNLGNGNDVIRADGVTPLGTPFAGPFAGSLVVNAGEGNDLVYVGSGTNLINGEAGDDDVGLFFGNSVVNLGSGTNEGFARVGGAVTIGQAGGATRVTAPNVNGDFFDIGTLFIQGSNENDVINAAGAATVLDLSTLGGNDTVVGGSQDDRVSGGDGNDEANGGPGNDDLHGDQGDDRLRGDAGNDSVSGGDGMDTCEAELVFECELSFPPPTNGSGGTSTPVPPGTGGPPPEDLKELLEEFLDDFADELERQGIGEILDIGAVVERIDGRPGVYRVLVTASVAPPQSVRSSARRKRIVIARGTKRVTTAGRTRIRVKLTRQGRRVLRRSRRLRVRVTAAHTSPTGQRVSASRRVTLRRKRR